VNAAHYLIWQSAGGANTHNFFSSNWVVGSFAATLRLESKATESQAFPGIGRHRYLLDLRPGETFGFQPDNGSYRKTPLNRVVASILPIHRIGINRGREWSNGAPSASPAVGQEIKRLVIYSSAPDAMHLYASGRDGADHPVHLLGDSFLNGYAALHHMTPTDRYVGTSQDGLGSTSLLECAIRYRDGDPKWHDSTLVIADMGTSSMADLQAGMDMILSILPHDRWFYLEPAPTHNLGTPQRDDYENRLALLRDICGSHWVPTLVHAQAQSDGSPEDEAEVAKGLWPLSIKRSLTDFHPNAKGDAFFGRLIRDVVFGVP
jgi:hypothetical protein